MQFFENNWFMIKVDTKTKKWNLMNLFDASKTKRFF